MIDGILWTLALETARTEKLEPPRKPSGSSLEPVKNFFNKRARLCFPGKTANWQQLEKLFRLRNHIAHNWGQIQADSDKKSLDGIPGLELGRGSLGDEVRLTEKLVAHAISIMHILADELEEHLGGDQPATRGC